MKETKESRRTYVKIRIQVPVFWMKTRPQLEFHFSLVSKSK